MIELKVGVIEHWDDERGFGFITPGNSGQSIYFNQVNLKDVSTLVQGDLVLFGPVSDRPKGPQALRVFANFEDEKVCQTCGRWLEEFKEGVG